MLDRAFLRPILDDESLTRGLGDEEARLMIEWLVEQAERLAHEVPGQAGTRLVQLCRRVRTVSRFVKLWCHDGDFGAAMQLAGAEDAPWPLPIGHQDPVDLTARLLGCEERLAVVLA